MRRVVGLLPVSLLALPVVLSTGVGGDLSSGPMIGLSLVIG